MPAILVPHSAIPELAERVTPDMLKVLGQLQKADFILNNARLDRTTVEILRRLTELGLVDPRRRRRPASGPDRLDGKRKWLASPHIPDRHTWRPPL